jgi:hypothetical protein
VNGERGSLDMCAKGGYSRLRRSTTSASPLLGHRRSGHVEMCIAVVIALIGIGAGGGEGIPSYGPEHAHVRGF